MLRLAYYALFEPRAAAYIGAALAGHPEFGSDLEAICRREAPNCQMRGIHDDDRWMDATAWIKAVRVQLLRPQTCAWHRREWGPFSTWGPWGLVAAYSLRGICLPPAALAVPVIGAWAATRRAYHPACGRSPACRRWRGW